MSKTEILAELPKLTPEELAEVQAKLDELAGEAWLDRGELTEGDKAALDATLADYHDDPDAGGGGGSQSPHPIQVERMTRRLIIRMEAEVDITDAAVWYQGQQGGIGGELLAEIDAALASAVSNPGDTRDFAGARRCGGF